MKILTLVGTRPELIKLSMVIKELDKHCEHILAHTGQNYDFELNEVFFRDLEIRKPDHFLECAGETAMETIASVLVKSDELFKKEKPDALLIYGDTNSCLAVISAKKHKIPIFHMEAGNRCFDQRVPEEINRKIVDHLSDINMPLTEHARDYLIREGLPPEQVIKTGSCMKEILNHFRPQIEKSDALNRLTLKEHKYFLVSSHREENVDQPDKLKDLMESLNQLAEKYDHPIIFSTHPRTRKRLEDLDYTLDDRVQIMKPLGFHDYIHLQTKAKCVISDSGTITEEAAILGFPAITVRDAHERPEGMDKGVLIMTNTKPKNLLKAIEITLSSHANQKFRSLVPDYEIEDVSSNVLKIIHSYVDYINRVVWKKTQ